MKASIILIALLGFGLMGCSGGEVQVTKDQEEAFRNPPKGIPPEVAEQMQKSREEGMRKAQEAMQKSQGSGQ